MKITTNIDAGRILRRRGLHPSGAVQRLFTQECAKAMDRYVPMQTGTLKNTRFIGPDYVEYNQPYAHYQYYGELMLSQSGSAWARRGERKHYAGKDLAYHGAPVRGKLWDIRMWADNRRRLTQLVARACGGRAR